MLPVVDDDQYNYEYDRRTAAIGAIQQITFTTIVTAVFSVRCEIITVILSDLSHAFQHYTVCMSVNRNHLNLDSFCVYNSQHTLLNK
jgi:hypothetical protein